jgi:hypothetical protein
MAQMNTDKKNYFLSVFICAICGLVFLVGFSWRAGAFIGFFP